MKNQNKQIKKRDKKINELKTKLIKQREDKNMEELIDGKLQERLNIQDKLQGQYLLVNLKRQMLKSYDKKINEAVKMKNTVVIFQDKPYDIEVANADYNLQLHSFKSSLRLLEYMMRQLELVGFNKEQINAVMEKGEFIKDKEELMKMENDLITPRIKSEEKLTDMIIELEEMESKFKILTKSKRSKQKNKKEISELSNQIESKKKKVKEFKVIGD